MPQQRPAPSSTANGSIEPLACSPKRRSISAAIRSGGAICVYQSFQSSPSFTASLSSSSRACDNGSSVACVPRSVTGSGQGIVGSSVPLESAVEGSGGVGRALQVGEVDLVNTALAFQAEEARLLDRRDLLDRLRAVVVADREIALLPERVIGQRVLGEIAVYAAILPIRDRVDLPAAAGPLEIRDLRAALGLVAAQAREPGVDAELAQRAAHRLHFVLLVVGVEAVEALIPTLAVARFLPSRRDLGAIDLEVDLEPCDEVVDEPIGLREQVARVDEQYWNLRVDLRDQMQRYGRLR